MKLLDFTVIFCAITMVACACETNGSGDSSTTPICTMEYKTIAVRVTSANGNPVKLDSVTVKNAKTGENITSSLDADLLAVYQQQGYYPIISDNLRKQLKEAPTSYIFTGYSNGKSIANTTLEIGADDCHITLLNGDTEIVL